MAATELPSGTVTFLFTDIEGSTKLLHELGAEGYAEALAAHRQVLREAFGRHSGIEVDTRGMRSSYAFPTARRCVGGGARRRRPTSRSRCGWDCTPVTPLLTAEGYVGADVHTRRADRSRRSRPPGPRLGGQRGAPRRRRAARPGRAPPQGPLGDPSGSTSSARSDFPPLKTLYRTNLPLLRRRSSGANRSWTSSARLLARDDIAPA